VHYGADEDICRPQKLIIYPSSPPRLAYRGSRFLGGMPLWSFIIDAHTGEIIYANDNLLTQGGGSYNKTEESPSVDIKGKIVAKTGHATAWMFTRKCALIDRIS